MPRPKGAKNVMKNPTTKKVVKKEETLSTKFKKDGHNLKDVNEQHAATIAAYDVLREIYQACEEPHIYPHLERALESLQLAHQLYCVLRRNEK